MLKIISSFVFILFLSMTIQAQWQKQNISTDADFRGLDVVSDKIVWASGTRGTVVRTIDGGESWDVFSVPDAEKLDFRDIEAFDANTAYVLSIGNGESSRIYKTEDGGKTWTLQFKNKNEKAFFDAFAFWDSRNGIAMSDPVGEFFLLMRTEDGKTWKPVGEDKIARAETGEAAFAASGTCIFAEGKQNVWFVTGGKKARVFRSLNRGLSWFVSDAPIVSGEDSQGIFSVSFRDALHGVIVGGDYQKPNEGIKNIAVTSDGGKTWKLIDNALTTGYRSCVVYAGKALVAVGTSGSDISYDDGKTWKSLDKENYNSVAFINSKVGWAAGPKGRIARFK